jgi:hypothetical protein
MTLLGKMSRCLFAAVFVMAAVFYADAAELSPVGTYLWFPGRIGANADRECRELVARVRPSGEKAEMSFWGAVPDGAQFEESFYLILTESRMEATYAAEGDYSSGAVEIGETKAGKTSFRLMPDDHPGLTIQGEIVAKPGKEIIAVTIRGIPVDGGKVDRTTYFCRFEEPESAI